jgi:hypothetical protein
MLFSFDAIKIVRWGRQLSMHATSVEISRIQREHMLFAMLDTRSNANSRLDNQNSGHDNVVVWKTFINTTTRIIQTTTPIIV